MNLDKIIKTTIALTTTLLILNACGSSGGDNGYSTYQEMADKFKHDTVDVKYTLNGTKRPTCHNADNIGTLNPGNNDEIKCVWHCGRYSNIKGRESDTISVFLRFNKSENTDDGIWELTSENTYEASPTVCRDI